MTHTWGYHEHGSMTQPVPVQICFEADTNIITGIQMLMDAYAATVHTPWFYFVETISPAAGGFELQWGT